MATARIGKRAVAELRKLLKETPHEVLGHIESSAVCCRVGTVAIRESGSGFQPGSQDEAAGQVSAAGG